MSNQSFDFGKNLVKQSSWWDDFKAKKGIGTAKPKVKVVGPEKTEKKAEYLVPLTPEQVRNWKPQLIQEKEAGVGSTLWEGAKFLPGVGAIPSFVDAGRAAMQGNWGTALGEGAMGALSMIPGGTVARGLGAAGKLAGKGLGMAGKVGLAGGEAAAKGLAQGASALGKAAPGMASRMPGVVGTAAKDFGSMMGQVGAKMPGVGAAGAAGQGAAGFASRIPGMASQAGSAASSFAKGIPGRATGSLASGINAAGKGISGFAPATGAHMTQNAVPMARNMMGAAPKFGLQLGINNMNNNTRDNFYNSPGYKYNQPRYY